MSAVFSPCRTYRYGLWRSWGTALDQAVLFIGLNPSTADETKDDPTIRRCVGFAKRWGFGTLIMANLFAYRATDPGDMIGAADPVGPENDEWLRRLGEHATVIVAAWGVLGEFRNRDVDVCRLLPGQLFALGLTKSGQPRHPLYLRSNAERTLYLGRALAAGRPGLLAFGEGP